MAQTDVNLYRRASEIIRIAMGPSGKHYKNDYGDLRKRGTPIMNADLDPLAYWCGVEAIVELVKGSKNTQQNE